MSHSQVWLTWEFAGPLQYLSGPLGRDWDAQDIASEDLMWECGWVGTTGLWKCGSPPSDWSNCFYSLEKLRNELSKFPMSFHTEFSPADSIFTVIAHPSCFFFVELKRAAANSGEMHFLGA